MPRLVVNKAERYVTQARLEASLFAFRLIARDTVEERVLELQNTKRQLADAILGAGTDLARTLKKEDLELLPS